MPHHTLEYKIARKCLLFLTEQRILWKTHDLFTTMIVPQWSLLEEARHEGHYQEGELVTAMVWRRQLPSQKHCWAKGLKTEVCLKMKRIMKTMNTALSLRKMPWYTLEDTRRSKTSKVFHKAYPTAHRCYATTRLSRCESWFSNSSSQCLLTSPASGGSYLFSHTRYCLAVAPNAIEQNVSLA